MDELDSLKTEVQSLRAQIQRERRRRRAGAGVALLAVVGFVLAGADDPSQVLAADRIELGDADGRIVLSTDGDPQITLTGDDGRTTRISLGGIEVSAPVPDPTELPTVDESGIGDPERTEDKGLPVTVTSKKNVYLSHVEITCRTGFRNRAAFRDQRAVVHVPADSRDCRATFGGGVVANKIAVLPGDSIECGPISRKATTINCTPIARGPRSQDE